LIVGGVFTDDEKKNLIRQSIRWSELIQEQDAKPIIW
jgi:hypothetical protein